VLKREHERVERLNELEKLEKERQAIREETSQGGLMAMIAVARIFICSGGKGMPDVVVWVDEDDEIRRGYTKASGQWRFPPDYIDDAAFFPVSEAGANFDEVLESIAKAIGVPGKLGSDALRSCLSFFQEGDFKPLLSILDHLPVHSIQALLVYGSELAERMGVRDFKGYASHLFAWFDQHNADPLAIAPAVIKHFGKARDLAAEEYISHPTLEKYAAHQFKFIQPAQFLDTHTSGDIAILAAINEYKIAKVPPAKEVVHHALAQRSLEYINELVNAGVDFHEKLDDGRNAYHSVGDRFASGLRDGIALIEMLAAMGVNAEADSRGVYPYYAMQYRANGPVSKEEFLRARDMILELQELANPTMEGIVEPTPLARPAFFSLLRRKGN
jgi:hypothetical protein